MTISLQRRQKLAAIAKAHDEWVDENLASVSFDPVDYPKPGSDYNLHYLDVEASGEEEDALAAKVATIVTAAVDPDWDPKEHPRGPDGKFIESDAVTALKKKISEISVAKNVAYMKDETYKAQSLHEQLMKLEQELEGVQATEKAMPSLPKISVMPPAAGKSITAWTKTIYSGNYADGQVAAYKDDGSQRLVWDAEDKKFIVQRPATMPDATGWVIVEKLNKKQSYEKFKAEKKSWFMPAAGESVVDSAPPPEVGPSSPQFKILPKDERGRSGDGYFADNFWGKYGAAGLMMRHTDEQGEERFLLVQANMLDNPQTYGKWQLPGGAIEELETPEQGAAREVFEELGFSQDFLYNMKQRETHAVTFDVPGFGPWSYSNIAVDVPTRPEPRYDLYELGGAQWFTRAELDEMRRTGQIIKPLEANFDSVLAKFNDDPKVPEPTPIKNQPPPPTRVRPPAKTTIPTVEKGLIEQLEGFTPSEFSAWLSLTNIPEVFPKFDPNVQDLIWQIAMDHGLDTKLEKALGNYSAVDALPLSVPKISQEDTNVKTVWTKKKFTQTVAYKKDYAPREIVGMTAVDGKSRRIIWENGKFHSQTYDSGVGWKYFDSWNTKKAALEALKNTDFYQPPKGTSADTNHDFMPGYSIKGGNSTITTKQNTDVLKGLLDAVPLAQGTGKITTKPWGNSSRPFGDYVTSLTVNSTLNDGAHIGAIHERRDGVWVTEGVQGVKTYLPSTPFYSETKEQGLLALEKAYDDYLAVQTLKSSPVAAKKLPKLTAAQIEKQNGAVPKSLKQAQRTLFLKNLREKSPMGQVNSSDPDTKKLFTALAYAVKQHNESNSPKINYLQGLNLLDQVYGSKQKNMVIEWLGTAEGKSLAPKIVASGGLGIPGDDAVKHSESGAVTAIKVNARLATVSSPYEISVPEKASPGNFKEFSLSDAIDMHQKMEETRPLTSVQREAVRNYTQSASPFNDPLRGNGEDSLWNPWTAQKIADLQSAMRPVIESFTVKRSTGGLGAALNTNTSADDVRKLKGAIIKDPAFLSTSIQGGSFNEDRFQLIINVPKGTPAVWAHHFSNWENEREILLAAGLHYRIDSIDPPTASGWNRNVYLTIVPEKVKK